MVLRRKPCGERGREEFPKPMAKLTKELPRVPFLFLFRVTVGLAFLYASFGKILDPKTFAENLLDYHIFSSALVIRYLAVTLPWIEWFCGILLILGLFIRSVSFLASGLFFSFGVAMASAMLRGMEINCGCFANAHEVISPFTLLRDGLFLLMSLTILFSRADAFTIQNFIAQRKQCSN